MLRISYKQKKFLKNVCFDTVTRITIKPFELLVEGELNVNLDKEKQKKVLQQVVLKWPYTLQLRVNIDKTLMQIMNDALSSLDLSIKYVWYLPFS